MIDTRSFVPLPMNPLHTSRNEDSTQFETDLKTSTKLDSCKEITRVPQKSTSSLRLDLPCLPNRPRNLPSQPSSSDFTIIEIIKPDKEKHDSDEFIPAFAKPYLIQDSSSESATLMNLRPLKAYMITGPDGQASIHQRLTHQSQSTQQQSIHPQFTHLQSIRQSTRQQSDDSSFSDETQSSPISDPPPFPMSKKLTKVKVVFWVNELRRYLFLWETGRMNSAHATELHQLLCEIEDKMAHPFLTPQVLGETSLGRVMKSFRHGGLDARSKEVARRIIQYWRKVCLEA